MAFRVPRTVRLLVPSAIFFLSASAAHAQRIPEIAVWSAGAALFAPLLAVPIKTGILHLRAHDAEGSRLWSVSAIEWVLWFPLVFIMLRAGRPIAVPLVLPVVLALVVWVHKESVANTSLRTALLLSLPTPILALALPFLAFIVASQFENYLPKSLL